MSLSASHSNLRHSTGFSSTQVHLLWTPQAARGSGTGSRSRILHGGMSVSTLNCSGKLVEGSSSELATIRLREYQIEFVQILNDYKK